MSNSDVIVNFVLALISVLSVVITSYVVPYIKSKIGENKFDRLIYYISVAVRCAEQIYTKEQWMEKKQYVMDYVLDLANEKLHLDFTYGQLETIVEGIVNEIKYPNGKKELEVIEIGSK